LKEQVVSMKPIASPFSENGYTLGTIYFFKLF
jgi:hypothetical protein